MKHLSATLRAPLAGASLLLFLCPTAGARQVELAEGQKLEPTSPTSFHSFGQRLALDGDTLLVGAPESVSSGPGHAYAFTDGVSGWSLQQKFSPPGGAFGLAFGRSVALDGNTALVGADRTAFVYVRSGSVWSLQRELTPTIGTGTSYAGSVSVDGDTAVIGQFGMTESRVWVWVRSGTTWTVQATFAPAGGGLGTGFGQAVAVVGNTLVVGANLDAQAGSSAGAVYVYTRSGTVWTQQAKLIGSPAFAGRRMGSSVDLQAVANGTFELAAGGASNAASSVLLFRGSGATWTQTGFLSPTTGMSESWFGGAVDLDGDRLAVGSWRADTTLPDTGSGTVYRRCGAAWVRQCDLVASDASTGDSVGISVAIRGETVALGAPGQDGAASNSGAVYAFELGSASLVTYCHGDGSGTDCPCGNEIPAGTEGGCRNSTGFGAVAITDDSVQVASDKFRVYSCGLLPGQPALCFVGTLANDGGAGVGFGDGLRCAGGTVVRLGVRTPDAAGDAIWGPGLRTLGGWTAGDTRYFQVWYRNPTGSPCLSNFNLSNGVQVLFEP